MKQTFIYVTDTTEFFHYYPNPPVEVSYLRTLHRHLLHIKVKVEVFSTDREIEFIMLKHKLREYMDKMEYKADCSCELFAEMLLCFIQYEYGTERDVVITVSEDNENGCELIYRKEEANA